MGLRADKGRGCGTGGVGVKGGSIVQVKYWRALHCVMNLCRIGCE